MSYKKKTVQSDAQVEITTQDWKFEDGVDANSTPEHQAAWKAEYLKRKEAARPQPSANTVHDAR